MKNLNLVVNRLVSTHLSLAVRNHSFFINDVPGDMAIDHNREWIASVISGLLSMVTGHVKNSCIRLSARKHRHIIVFTIRESVNTNSYAMASELKQAYSLAEKIGGCLSISVPVMDNTTISFSFPNLPTVAAWVHISSETEYLSTEACNFFLVLAVFPKLKGVFSINVLHEFFSAAVRNKH